MREARLERPADAATDGEEDEDDEEEEDETGTESRPSWKRIGLRCTNVQDESPGGSVSCSRPDCAHANTLHAACQSRDER